LKAPTRRDRSTVKENSIDCAVFAQLIYYLEYSGVLNFYSWAEVAA